METKEALEDTIRKHQDSIKSARGHEKDASVCSVLIMKLIL